MQQQDLSLELEVMLRVVEMEGGGSRTILLSMSMEVRNYFPHLVKREVIRVQRENSSVIHVVLGSVSEIGMKSVILRYRYLSTLFRGVSSKMHIS
jgi:hypothetical protein